MCEKCDEIDAKIIHYLWMNSAVTDVPTRDGIASLVEDLRAEKAELHPSDESGARNG